MIPFLSPNRADRDTYPANSFINLQEIAPELTALLPAFKSIKENIPVCFNIPQLTGGG